MRWPPQVTDIQAFFIGMGIAALLTQVIFGR